MKRETSEGKAEIEEGKRKEGQSRKRRERRTRERSNGMKGQAERVRKGPGREKGRRE